MLFFEHIKTTGANRCQQVVYILRGRHAGRNSALAVGGVALFLFHTVYFSNVFHNHAKVEIPLFHDSSFSHFCGDWRG